MDENGQHFGFEPCLQDVRFVQNSPIFSRLPCRGRGAAPRARTRPNVTRPFSRALWGRLLQQAADAPRRPSICRRIAILPRPSRAPPPSGPASDSKSHFNRSFGNIKAFNLKKLKLSLSPSPPWPQAACGWGATAGKFLRQTKGGTVFGLESFESIPDLKPLEVQ